ncbi:PfkB family carbohydrate kinase [Thiomicrorhabdus sp. Kp2]|uniref:PfkB family carbohydrate kinase n=1 Tax=Thiomicrorhabdus sp. Kp2 TaxID=1123518 RepID=UPI00040008CB|nr:PfkB family carbohydrate kinase [Thiomicrorhabdus sp. Kp2]
MQINVVGGCYKELCDWPSHNQTLGSAGRACKVLSSLKRSDEGGVTLEVCLHSLLNESDIDPVKSTFFMDEISCEFTPAENTYAFYYFHPLSKPEIYPNILKSGDFCVDADSPSVHALVFGMIEANPVVTGHGKVVYDPQDSKNPKLYKELKGNFGSLVIILNSNEAKLLYERVEGKKEVDVRILAEWLLNEEGAYAVVIKSGTKGAFCYSSIDKISKWISPFITKNVFPIGSGDIFSSSFTYFWACKELSLIEAVVNASASTAFYCDSSAYPMRMDVKQYSSLPCLQQSTEPLNVYLAGPFFSLSQMWMINETRIHLQNAGFDVFSPYHDVGIGSAEKVVEKDIQGIEECDVLYAIFDGRDPGTLFEVGYAIKAGKKVVIFAEDSTSEELKMYEGTGCFIYKDFTSSIYAVSWV